MGMFDVATERADDNAKATKNGENQGIHGDVNKKTC